MYGFDKFSTAHIYAEMLSFTKFCAYYRREFRIF